MLKALINLNFAGIDDYLSTRILFIPYKTNTIGYYTWVDWFDTLGLGRNVPLATGNLNDAMLALVNGQFVNLRVPYPIGFFTKWAEGRIDDANAGWKGRAMWTTYSTRTMFHLEGGKENRPKVVKFQLRPDPLAR